MSRGFTQSAGKGFVESPNRERIFSTAASPPLACTTWFYVYAGINSALFQRDDALYTHMEIAWHDAALNTYSLTGDVNPDTLWTTLTSSFNGGPPSVLEGFNLAVRLGNFPGGLGAGFVLSGFPTNYILDSYSHSGLVTTADQIAKVLPLVNDVDVFDFSGWNSASTAIKTTVTRFGKYIGHRVWVEGGAIKSTAHGDSFPHGGILGSTYDRPGCALAYSASTFFNGVSPERYFDNIPPHKTYGWTAQRALPVVDRDYCIASGHAPTPGTPGCVHYPDLGFQWVDMPAPPLPALTPPSGLEVDWTQFDEVCACET